MQCLRNVGSRIARTVKGFTHGVAWIPCILICVFGLSSWLAINGMWAELPVIVPVLPEGNRLPSILIITTQIANVGPLIYICISSVSSYVKKKRVNLEIPAVFVIILLGIITCVLLAIFWDYTSVLFNKRRSVPLIVLSFFLALVDCTSTLVYIPYMERFPEKYISALFIGESFGALFPSLLALIQGSYEADNNSTNSSFANNIFIKTTDNNTSSSYNGLLFSVDLYFVFLAVMTVVSGGGFVLLNWLPSCRKWMVYDTRLLYKEKIHHHHHTSRDSSPLGIVNSEPSSIENSNTFENSPLILTPQNSRQFAFKEVIGRVKISPRTKEIISLTDLFVQIMWLNFLSNGAVPAVSIFVFQPYGNNTYHLATNLGIAAGPIAGLITMFLPCLSRWLTIVWTLISSVFNVAVIVLAAMAPRLPMVGSNWGNFIVVSNHNLVRLCTCFLEPL